MAKATLSVNDYSGEVSTAQVRVASPADGAAYDAWLTAKAGLLDAILAVTIGTERKRALSVVETDADGTKPVNEFAQRETKWLVKYVQDDGRAGSFEIPCADLALLDSGGEKMDVSAGDGLALVTAIEGNVIGLDGQLVTVTDIFHVGRNI